MMVGGSLKHVLAVEEICNLLVDDGVEKRSGDSPMEAGEVAAVVGRKERRG